jgi:hypothetical protein
MGREYVSASDIMNLNVLNSVSAKIIEETDFIRERRESGISSPLLIDKNYDEWQKDVQKLGELNDFSDKDQAFTHALVSYAKLVLMATEAQEGRKVETEEVEKYRQEIDKVRKYLILK